MDIPTNFDELVNHFQSQGEPESFNLDLRKMVIILLHFITSFEIKSGPAFLPIFYFLIHFFNFMNTKWFISFFIF
jgi:hypothetical protein